MHIFNANTFPVLELKMSILTDMSVHTEIKFQCVSVNVKDISMFILNVYLYISCFDFTKNYFKCLFRYTKEHHRILLSKFND